MLLSACSPETRGFGQSGAPGPASTLRERDGDVSGPNGRVDPTPGLSVVDGGALEARADAGKAPAVRKADTFANLDPDDDLIVGPPEAFGDCEARLTKAGVAYTLSSLPVHTEKKGRITCGAPEVVVYRGGPGKIAYRPQPVLTCGMALALAYYETVMQSEAVAELGSPIARIDQLGTYACREVAAYPGTVSEHAYANAIDLARFTLKNGGVVEVARDFDAGQGEPKRAQGRFLRKISRRGNDEDVFSHVLTSFFNPAHKDHFHLDLARYRQDGTR
jgi:hypothetical protein